MKNQSICYVFVGNPGAGKSTFLNSIVGEPVFRSGMSIGTGLTSLCQVYKHKNGNKYIDTPGLSDISLRQKAADEITIALKQDGVYRIFFVITLEDGRIRPDDKTTMKLVLNSASCIGNSYSVIVNKVKKKAMPHFKEISTAKRFFELMNSELNGTNSFYFYEFDDGLDCMDDAVKPLSQDFLTFFTTAPAVYIQQNQVNSIELSEFEAHKKEMAEKMSSFEKNEELLKLKCAQQEQLFEQMKKEQESKLEEFKAEIRNKDLNHQEKILNLNAKITQTELTSQQREAAMRNEMAREKKDLETQFSAKVDQEKKSIEAKMQALEANQQKPLRVSPLASQRVKIILSKKTHKAMDVDNASLEAGTHISQYALHNGWNQQWFIESTGSDAKTYKITSRISGLVLDISGASTKGGAQLVQWPWHGGANQQWVLEETIEGYFFIKSAGSGLVLDVCNASTADSAKIIQWYKHGGENQLWKIIDL